MDVSFLYDHLGEIDCQSKYKFVTDSVQINVCGKCDLDLAEAKPELRGRSYLGPGLAESYLARAAGS